MHWDGDVQACKLTHDSGKLQRLRSEQQVLSGGVQDSIAAAPLCTFLRTVQTLLPARNEDAGADRVRLGKVETFVPTCQTMPEMRSSLSMAT